HEGPGERLLGDEDDTPAVAAHHVGDADAVVGRTEGAFGEEDHRSGAARFDPCGHCGTLIETGLAPLRFGAMRIPDLLAAADEPCFSFEFFPPKTSEGVEELFANVEDLNRLEPSFVSVTYGAAGSTREGTVEVTTRLKRDYGI